MDTPIHVTCIHPGFVKTEMTAKNPHKMWWLMETDDAVERMGRAIVAGKRVHGCPLPMSMLMRVAHAIPDALYDPSSAHGPSIELVADFVAGEM